MPLDLRKNLSKVSDACDLDRKRPPLASRTLCDQPKCGGSYLRLRQAQSIHWSCAREMSQFVNRRTDGLSLLRLLVAGLGVLWPTRSSQSEWGSSSKVALTWPGAGVRDASVAARLLDVSLLVHEGKGDLRGKHSSPVRHSRAKCGRQRSNWKHEYYSANAKQVRREARRQFRLLRQLMAAGTRTMFSTLSARCERQARR